jgi:carbon-monoxide dehydrogenase medium subunit
LQYDANRVLGLEIVGRWTLQDFEYLAAQSVDEVVSLLNQNGKSVQILSGGTDLLVQLREGRKAAQLVVDIKHIPDVNELAYSPLDGLTIGAAVSCSRICQDAMVVSAYPGLVDAFSLIGGTQIQGRASVGGNLCNASPAGDAIPALIVHSAVALVAGPQGRREIAVEDFCSAPGQTELRPGEFLVALRIPPPALGSGAAYLRFIPRNEMDIAVVGAGAWVVLDEQRRTFVSARVALGAVAPKPLFASEVGGFLAGRAATPENIHEAAVLAQAAARPISDMRGTAEQRRHLSLILTRRTLSKAVERARGGAGKIPNRNGHVS